MDEATVTPQNAVKLLGNILARRSGIGDSNDQVGRKALTPDQQQIQELEAKIKRINPLVVLRLGV
jgi:hypothetical protein